MNKVYAIFGMPEFDQVLCSYEVFTTREAAEEASKGLFTEDRLLSWNITIEELVVRT